MTDESTATHRWAGLAPASAPTPLVVLLHGYSSNAADLASLVPSLPARFRYVSLQAPHPSDTPYEGYEWFPVAFVEVPGGVQVRAEANDLARFADRARRAVRGVLDRIDALRAEPGVAPWPRLAIVGFSQGGVLALEALRQAPDSVDAVGVLSGFADPRLRADDPQLATRPVFWGYGSADIVVPESLREPTGRWLRAHVDLTEYAEPGLGHAVSPGELRELGRFLVSALG